MNSLLWCQIKSLWEPFFYFNALAALVFEWTIQRYVEFGCDGFIFMCKAVAKLRTIKVKVIHYWFHGSSFKGFSIVFPAPWLAEVESSQKSNGMWFFRHFFAPFLFHRSRNNRLDKLRSKFWREKMFRKPHSKLLRWFSVHGTNNTVKSRL